MKGNKITSLIYSCPVRSISILSIPNPAPPVGGNPYSRQFTKSSSYGFADSFPAESSFCCFSSSSFCFFGSFNSEYAFPSSVQRQNGSNLSISLSSPLFILHNGVDS